MDTQGRQLAELIENMMYCFGTQSMDGECCENIAHGEFRALHTALHQDVCTMQDIAQKAARPASWPGWKTSDWRGANRIK